MHPDAALRYLPLVDIIKQNEWMNKSILEIGSGSYGITPYLKKEVVGVDQSFDEPEYPFLKRVKGKAQDLPFSDNKFDVVILSDVVEHIPSGLRQKVLNEAVRVAKLAVLISGPFGDEAMNQDKELAEYSIKTLGTMHPFFKDHLEYGLPKLEDLMSWINLNKKIKKTEVVGEFLNLGTRKWLMRFFITRNKFIFYFYLKGLMFLVPFLRLMNKKPCYRTLILLQLAK